MGGSIKLDSQNGCGWVGFITQNKHLRRVLYTLTSVQYYDKSKLQKWAVFGVFFTKLVFHQNFLCGFCRYFHRLLSKLFACGLNLKTENFKKMRHKANLFGPSSFLSKALNGYDLAFFTQKLSLDKKNT